jgi:hypothetical protein
MLFSFLKLALFNLRSLKAIKYNRSTFFSKGSTHTHAHTHHTYNTHHTHTHHTPHTPHTFSVVTEERVWSVFPGDIGTNSTVFLSFLL